MKEELRKVVWACRAGVIQAKAQLELRGSRDVKGNMKSFYNYISNKRVNKENVGALLKGLVISDTRHRWGCD